MSKVTAEQINSSLKKFSQELAQCSRVAPDEVPPGWFTIDELSAEIDKSHCITRQRIQHMLKRNQVERKNFVIQLENRIRPVAHYRLK